MSACPVAEGSAPFALGLASAVSHTVEARDKNARSGGRRPHDDQDERRCCHAHSYVSQWAPGEGARKNERRGPRSHHRSSDHSVSQFRCRQHDGRISRHRCRGHKRKELRNNTLGPRARARAEQVFLREVTGGGVANFRANFFTAGRSPSHKSRQTRTGAVATRAEKFEVRDGRPVLTTTGVLQLSLGGVTPRQPLLRQQSTNTFKEAPRLSGRKYAITEESTNRTPR